MNRLLLARGLAVTAAAYAVLVIVAGAALKPGYSHVANFISELGASGTPYGSLVSLAGFLPVGLLLAAFLLLAAPFVRVRGTSRAGYWLLLSQAVAYVGVAFAPCDAGCPAEGSAIQQLHNLLSLLTYVAAGVGLFMLASAPSLSRTAKVALVLAGIGWLLAFFLMLSPGLAEWRGLIQRGAEAILWGVVLFIAFRMTSEQRNTPA